MTMDDSEKILTEKEKKVNNLLITDALDTFNILLEIGIEREMNIPQISDKTGISTQAIYRYSSDFNSQTKSQPSVSILAKLSDALGYEIRVVKKNK
jgi:DNA-binding phage protein